jgi:hypothetical protein
LQQAVAVGDARSFDLGVFSHYPRLPAV